MHCSPNALACNSLGVATPETGSWVARGLSGSILQEAHPTESKFVQAILELTVDSRCLLAYLENGLTKNHQILGYTSLHTRRFYNYIAYDVTCISGRKLSTFEKSPKMTPPTASVTRITKIGTHIRADILTNHIGYDVTDYFRLAVIEVQKKRSKMPHPTAPLLYIS